MGIDGMDSSKEIMCSMYGDKFLERGMAHFIYDGPGQGECTYREILVTPIAGDIKCPVLIQAGEDDELSPIEFSDELVGNIRSPKKLVIYEGERHAIGGNNLSSSLGENWFTMLADWCLDRIEGKSPPNERVFINSFG